MMLTLLKNTMFTLNFTSGTTRRDVYTVHRGKRDDNSGFRDRLPVLLNELKKAIYYLK